MIREGTAFKSLAFAIVVIGMTGCASSPEPATGSPGARPVAVPDKPFGTLSTAERAAAVALQEVGVPYRYGGQSPSGFDCSGLVHYSFARAGASVPRTTKQLWSASRFVDKGQLREGDLLFFRFDGKIAHVGMYLGGGRFVHAPSSGKTVSVQPLWSGIYREAFVRAGRL